MRLYVTIRIIFLDKLTPVRLGFSRSHSRQFRLSHTSVLECYSWKETRIHSRYIHTCLAPASDSSFGFSSFSHCIVSRPPTPLYSFVYEDETMCKYQDFISLINLQNKNKCRRGYASKVSSLPSFNTTSKPRGPGNFRRVIDLRGRVPKADIILR